ncbi:MAG TPA: histidine kinase [Phnomibacter sp.]|nr:histidine kinase [Phnomibacter sp.]
MLILSLDVSAGMENPTRWLRNLATMFGGWMLLIFLILIPIIFKQPTYFLTVEFAVDYLLYGFINFLAFFIVSVYIAKRYYLSKQYFQFALAIVALIFAFYFLKLGVGFLFYDIILKSLEVNGQFTMASAVDYFITCLRVSCFAVILGVGHRGAIDWIKTEKLRRELEKEKHLAELSFLKMQMNPHFLFNSLNNLYSLSVLENSEHTGEGILKLSNLMRYMLYEKEDTNNEVELQKEVEQLNGLIDLQQLRYDGKAQILFVIEGDIKGLRVAPLMLLPLLENAFKHGILNKNDKPVEMKLVAQPGLIVFELSNYINNYQKDKTGGVGLENVKKRLKLLYPDRHSFNIEKTEELFKVQLTLHLL